MPVLLGTFGGQSGEFEVQATASATSVVSSSSSTALPADTSADSLLDSTKVTGLLRAGAREGASGGSARLLGATASIGSDPEEAAGDEVPIFDAVTTGPGTEFDAPASSDDSETDETTPAGDGSNDDTADRSETVSQPNPTIPPAPAEPTASPPTPSPSPPAPTTPPPPGPTAAASPAPTETTAPAPAPPTEPTAAQWATLRQCEAWGNYAVVSGNGKYFGAYQFSQGTWDNIARASGRSDLVGVRPSDASPADQDALALSLWRTSGWSSWPSCGKKAAVA